MGVCQICGNRTQNPSTLCKKCELSVFQVLEILRSYIEEYPPPNWITEAVKELAWVFREYPRTMGYLNTAEEVTEVFIIDREDEVRLDDLDEINFTNLPRDKVVDLLEKALIVERRGDKLLPGKLVKKLQLIRWQGYEMDTPQIEAKLLELKGILTIALTKSMIEEKDYLPQRALAILNIISEKMIYEGEEISPLIEEDIVRASFAKLTGRQKARLLRVMSGFADGKTKIIKDVPEGRGPMPLKEVMITYTKNMLERYRERARDRDREID